LTPAQVLHKNHPVLLINGRNWLFGSKQSSVLGKFVKLSRSLSAKPSAIGQYAKLGRDRLMSGLQFAADQFSEKAEIAGSMSAVP
jgi:hypothetical protein